MSFVNLAENRYMMSPLETIDAGQRMVNIEQKQKIIDVQNQVINELEEMLRRETDPVKIEQLERRRNDHKALLSRTKKALADIRKTDPRIVAEFERQKCIKELMKTTGKQPVTR